MIAYLTGKILDHTIDRIIIDVQGVGYEVYVPV
ncbi:MAG: OB-fold domain-containing protein, partial [Myxococcota bacterium]|nr:OB-fold domain-containing protein [Myxococcota bacterium]